MRYQAHRRRVLIGVVWLMGFASVWTGHALAEDRDMSPALTVEAAVAMALQDNRGLQVREQDRAQARGVLLSAESFPNPELDLAVETNGIFGRDGEGRASVGIAQTIVTGGKRRRRMEIARLGLDRAERTIDDVKRRLIGEVGEAFYRLLFVQERLKLVGEQLQLAHRLVAISEGRFREGFAPEMDVNLAKIELHHGLQEVVSLEQELVDARATLNLLIGRAADEPVAALGAWGAALAPIEDARFQEQAVDRRPDLLALNVEAEMSAETVALARAERVPDLTISVDVAEEKTVLDAPDVTDRDRLFGVRLTVLLPVFDRKRGELAQARSRREQAELEVAVLRERIARDVRAASARIASSAKRVDHFANDLMPLAEGNLELTRRAYEQGATGILQILEAQRRFADTKAGYLHARYEHRLALVALEREVAAGPTRLEGDIQ